MPPKSAAAPKQAKNKTKAALKAEEAKAKLTKATTKGKFNQIASL
jgi:hypothetical protein